MKKKQANEQPAEQASKQGPAKSLGRSRKKSNENSRFVCLGSTTWSLGPRDFVTRAFLVGPPLEESCQLGLLDLAFLGLGWIRLAWAGWTELD